VGLRITVVIEGECGKPDKSEPCPSRFCLVCPFFLQDRIRVKKEGA